MTMKKNILGLLGLSTLLGLGYGTVFAQTLPTLGSAMTTSVISQPYTQSQCLEPDGSLVYVDRQFYLGDTYTTTDLVPRWGNGYDTLILNASNVKIYNPSLFNFTTPITYKSNGIPDSATVTSMLLAEGVFKVSSTAPGQLIYNIHRTALENAGSTSYALSYVGRPNLTNYTTQLTNKTFHNLAGRVVNGFECVNYTVHYCGDGVVDTKASITSLAGGYANTIANEQCDGSAGVPAGYTCTSSCTLETLVVKPTCTLSLSSASLQFGASADVIWAISGSYTNSPQITYTPTSSAITGLPYGVTSANGQRTITPQNVGTYIVSMTVSNSAGQSTCSAPLLTVIANPAPTCSLTTNTATISSGDTAILQASYTNATLTTFNPIIAGLGFTYPNRSNSNISVTPAITTIYTMTVTGAAGTTPAVCSTTITVKPKVVNPTCSLTAAASTITAGDSTSLSASYTNATATTFTPSIAGLSFTYPTRSNTNISVTPSTTTTYTMTVNGAAGTTPAVCSTTITVKPKVVVPTCSLTTNTATIYSGDTAILQASYTNATLTTFNPIIAGLGFTYPNRSNSNISVTPAITTIYTMTVTGTAGTTPAVCSTTITVKPKVVNPTCSLTTNTATISSGDTAILQASYTNATLTTFNPIIAGLGFTYPNRSNSNISVTPAITTIYTMTVTGAAGTTPAVCSTTITVKPKVVNPTCSLTAAASTITAGDSTSLSAAYTNATATTFNPIIAGLGFTYPNRSNSNISVTPAITTIYTMTVTGTAGTTPAVCSTTITVKPKVVNPTCSLTTNTATISSGDTAILQASYTNATLTTFNHTIAGLSLTYPNRSNNYLAVKPTTTTTYTMTVTGAVGTTPAVCSVIITVKPKVTIPTCTLTTSTPNIASGDTAILNAGYTNASGATMNVPGLNFILPNRSDSNIIVHPTTTTTYELKVQGLDGSCIICSVKVYVVGVGLTLTKTLDNDLPYQSGDLVSFTINFSNNSSVTGKNIVLTDYLPDSLSYVSSQLYGVTSSTFSTGTSGGMIFAQYSGFDLTPGQQGYLKIVGRYRGTGNSKINSVFLESSNAATLKDFALFHTIYIPTANAIITKTADKTNYMLGEAVHYTITVTNNGPDTINTVKIIDTWPNTGCIVADLPGSSNVSTMLLTKASNPFAWDLTPSLSIGQSVNVYLVGHISTNQSCIGSHINKVDLTYMVNGQTKTGSANVTIIVTGPAPTCTNMVGSTPIATANGYDVNLTCNGANTLSTTPISISCGNGTTLPPGQGSTINGVCHYTSSFGGGYAQCSVGNDTTNTACKVPINPSVGKCDTLTSINGSVAIYQNGVAESTFRCQTKAGTVAKSITMVCNDGITHIGYDTSSYTATCRYTNIAVPQSYTIKCIVDGETPPTACQAPLIVDKGRLGYCGDGIAEGYEKCDDGITRNGTASSNCTKGCDLKGSSMVGCFNIGNTDISIQKGEVLPFRWTLEDTSNIIPGNSCDGKPDGKIPEDSIKCTFKIYNGTHLESDANPLMTFTKNCNDDNRNNYLVFKYFLDKQNERRSLKHAFGKYYIGTTTFGNIFGEYKITLDKVAYNYCRSDNLAEGTEIDRVCSVNFTLTQPYLAQKSSFGLTPKATDISLNGYKMIDGSELLKSTDLSDIMVIDESIYAGGSTITTKMANFITKYSKLAVKYGTIRSIENNVITTYKVPGQDIVVFKGAGTILYQEGASKTQPFTVILDGPSVQISGSIEHANAMFLLNKGNITFAGADLCSKPQVVKGIFVTNNGFFKAGPDLRNDNLNKKRCLYGGLKVQGILIGNGIQDLVQSRRSQLNDRFHVGGSSLASIKAERRNEIFNGAALLIEYSPSLRSALPPGASEFTKALDIYKQ